MSETIRQNTVCYIIGELDTRADMKISKIRVTVAKVNGVLTVRGSTQEASFGGKQRLFSIAPEEIDRLIELLEKGKLLGLKLRQEPEPKWLKNQRDKIPWIVKAENDNQVSPNLEEVIEED